MQHAANAYGRTSQMALPPRDLEAAVLIKAASRLAGIDETWPERRDDLEGALTYNRKLWTILASAATADDNPLPVDVKQGVARLAAFVMKQTFAIMIEPEPAKLRSLVSINREVAAGLRSQTRQAA